MGKQAVISISYQDLINPLPFKKNLLLFDKLIIEEYTLGLARQLVTLRSRGKSFDDSNYIFNNQTIDLLEKEGLLDFVKINEPIVKDLRSYESKNEEELEGVMIEIKKINLEAERLREKTKLLVDKNNLLEIIPDLATSFPSNFPRLISLQLNFRGLEAYPLFTKTPSYENIGKKEAVLGFTIT